MTHNKINYLDLFHKNGFRITRQRQVVLDAICQADGHITIGEIYYQSKKLDNNIDRSTIYRSLDLLVKLGLVITGEKNNSEQTYEMIKENHHHHLICKVCGNDVEIENKLVDDFYTEIGNAYNYEIVMDHLIIFGVCKKCSDLPMDLMIT
jgi:Fur family ferric uptake transcriptional regulator